MTYLKKGKNTKATTKKLRRFKRSDEGMSLQMLTCYDFQTAQMLNETSVDMLLVGDSLGNVVLGFENTVQVTTEHMKIFGAAVKRGAPNKFLAVDLPFGTYATVEDGLKTSIDIFQSTGCEAIKLEGASETKLELIKRLTENGIPVVGHIGLTPQSVHEMGGYYTHGKKEEDRTRLKEEARALEEAGIFCLVLECVYEDLSREITESLSIPTIGIGSGSHTDGQVLVTNDLLHLGPHDPPKFCRPIANLFEKKRELIEDYLKSNRGHS